jgi:hypothetical protein
MTGSHDAFFDATDDDPLGPVDGQAPPGADPVLHSFAVRARFRREAEGQEHAEAAVRAELEVVRGLYDDVEVEPREPDGRWAVDVRFVVASLDAETAVDGVHATLRESGVVPDETWVAERLP